MSKVDLTRPLEVKINGKWHRCLGVNYDTPEPTVNFFSKGSGRVTVLNGEKVNIPTNSSTYGWPLKEADFRNTPRKGKL